MNFQHLIEQYGYYAVLVGTFFEGETILVIAGFLAHQGYLKLAGVIAAAFLGAMLGDQLYFYIGRWKGVDFLASRPLLQRRREWLAGLIRDHQNLLILGFRFLYGFRTVTPFILGASRVGPLRFFILNALGALLWSLVIGIAGYYFGKVLESLLGRLKDYEMIIIGAVSGIAVLVWLGRRLINRYWRPDH